MGIPAGTIYMANQTVNNSSKMYVTIDEFGAYIQLKSLVVRIARGEIGLTAKENIVNECKIIVADLVNKKLVP